MSEPNAPQQGAGAQPGAGTPTGPGATNVPGPDAPFNPPIAYGEPGYQAPPVEVTPPQTFDDKTWDDVKEARREESNAGYAPGEAPNVEYEQHDGPEVIATGNGHKSGLIKCAKCGSTDIGFNVVKGALYCNFCRFEWQGTSAVTAYHLNAPIGELRGLTIGSGSENIVPDTDVVVSFKCSACGAEVVVDTANAMQARCHWCRHTLSVSEQMPNGAVPDAILPFSLPKEEAVKRIQDFVDSRKFFALRKFKAEFSAENVMGVYLPYMIVDVNARMNMDGVGEHKVRTYQVGSENNRRTVYDADQYRVARSFELHVDDLTLESAADKADINVHKNTNNIINSIMPFDTKQIVEFDPNYLSGFSSQRRDTNVEGIAGLAAGQAQDIGRYQMLPTLKHYDRGVRWDHESLEVVGERWISAYLPVWLYSYYEKKSNGNELLHYIAVNGRTGETMGSIPINMGKLFAAAAVAQVVGTIATILIW